MFDPKVHAGVAARLLREKDGQLQVLLLLRNSNATHGANTWGLPGGWVDYGETCAYTAARELVEEINVFVQAETGVTSGVVTNTYHDKEMHIVCVSVDFEKFDDSKMFNVEPEKAAEVKWVNVEDLRTMDLFPPLESLARLWHWL